MSCSLLLAHLSRASHTWHEAPTRYRSRVRPSLSYHKVQSELRQLNRRPDRRQPATARRNGCQARLEDRPAGHDRRAGRHEPVVREEAPRAHPTRRAASSRARRGAKALQHARRAGSAAWARGSARRRGAWHRNELRRASASGRVPVEHHALTPCAACTPSSARPAPTAAWLRTPKRPRASRARCATAPMCHRAAGPSHGAAGAHARRLRCGAASGGQPARSGRKTHRAARVSALHEGPACMC